MPLSERTRSVCACNHHRNDLCHRGHHDLCFPKTIAVTSPVTRGDYSVFMTNSTQIRFAPQLTSMRDYLEPHLPWLEKVVGCPYAETLTFEIDLPIGRLVISELLDGVPLDDRTVAPPGFPTEVDHWELGGGVSPQIQLSLSRKKKNQHCRAGTRVECRMARTARLRSG